MKLETPLRTAAGGLDLSRGDANLRVPGLRPGGLPIRRVEPSPCNLACPAGVNVKAYVSLIAEGRFAEALAVVRERCPLPGICGRVCTHPCEAACERSDTDAPVAIRALKRFVADLEPGLDLPPPPRAPARPERVAVIGSGPAGLTAAYDLRLAGYAVTVFEAEPEPGGMLRYGIAAYRLPRPIIDAEIDYLLRTGIELKTGCSLGRDVEVESLMREGYDAVVLAVGTQVGRNPGFPGEDRPEVEDALGFLRRANDGQRVWPGRRVLVIGGGSTAVEAARTALRLGAEKVEVLYRRTREEMPADDEEVDGALAEGVTFRYLVAPARVVTEGERLFALECRQVGLGDLDASGRRKPVVLPGTEFLVEADRVLAAIGQEADLSFLPPRAKTKLEERGLLRADPSGQTPVSGVFAAGDVVTGPSTIIDAVAAGHAVAESVRRHLGEDVESFEQQLAKQRALFEYELPDDAPVPSPRHHPETSRLTPGHEYDEVEHAFTLDEALAEAQRCLRCGPCTECHVCATTCHHRHVELRTGDGTTSVMLRAPLSLAGRLALEARLGGALESRTGDETIEVLPRLRRIDEARCRGCGKCVEACAFDAVHLFTPGDGLEAWALIDPGSCRGCGLCAGVCSTDAPIAADGSGSSLRDEVLSAVARRDPAPDACIVLACNSLAPTLELGPELAGRPVEVVPVPCVGSVSSGTLLELHRRGDGPLIVAGCGTGHCRYGTGTELAAAHGRQAREFLQMFGGDAERIVPFWSNGPPGPVLERIVPTVPTAHAVRDDAGGES